MRVAALLLAAVGGAAVLMQEIMAAGWLAPLYGSGLQVWAVVLAISLASLALGAWLGRPSSRRREPRHSLMIAMTCLAVGGAFMAAAMAYVANADAADPPSLGLVASALLAPSLIAWGMMSPRLVQAYSDTGIASGRAAGATYAVGTIGSAGGALAAGLYLIPQQGLIGATLSLVVGIGATALIASSITRTRMRVVMLVLMCLAGVTWFCCHHTLDATDASDASSGAFGLQRIERVDSFYGRHEVLEDDVSRYLLVDGVLQTSAPLISLGPPPPGALLASGNALELARWMRPEPGRALVIGLGGGAFPNALIDADWQVQAVEIDPHVVSLARKHFDLSLPVTIEDGRRFLNRTSDTYSLIVLDVYRGELLPAHLFSEQAFHRMAMRLTSEGLLAVNLIGQPHDDAVRAILAAAMASFAHVQLFAPDRGATIAPMTLFASNGPIEDESSRDRASEMDIEWPTPINLESIDFTTAARLTDIHNPIEVLRQRVARLWRERSIRRFGRTSHATTQSK